jgi:hypothetical protein
MARRQTVPARLSAIAGVGCGLFLVPIIFAGFGLLNWIL